MMWSPKALRQAFDGGRRGKFCSFLKVFQDSTLAEAPVSSFFFNLLPFTFTTENHAELSSGQMFPMYREYSKNLFSLLSCVTILLTFGLAILHWLLKWFEPPHLRHVFPQAGHLLHTCVVPHPSSTIALFSMVGA